MSYSTVFENVSGFYERIAQVYTEDELKEIKFHRNMIDLQFRIASTNTSTKIFENQKKIASRIIEDFKGGSLINEMVISPTQSGKTGIICETIRLIIKETNIPHENIYIITGLSSVEWKKQTKKRIPDLFSNRVFHRNDLNSNFKEDIKTKKNIFIILDEVQIASAKNQTIHKVFKELGYMDIKSILEKDVKFIEITATPNGSIYDLLKWGENFSKKIIVSPPPEYTSCFKLLEENRVKDYKDLCDSPDAIENIKELKKTIKTVYLTPRYHIIRTKAAELQQVTKNNFNKVFGNKCNFIDFDFLSEESDINDILGTKPKKHTFIFIKEKLRCAKTIEDKSIMGVYYERFTSLPEDDVIIQGMLGRATGYNDNGDSIVYTNIDSINKYRELLMSNFERTDINWVSSSTSFKNDKLRSVNYFNTPSNITGFKAIEYENDIETIEEKKERLLKEKEQKELRKEERKREKEEKDKIKEEAKKVKEAKK